MKVLCFIVLLPIALVLCEDVIAPGPQPPPSNSSSTPVPSSSTSTTPSSETSTTTTTTAAPPTTTSTSTSSSSTSTTKPTSSSTTKTSTTEKPTPAPGSNTTISPPTPTPTPIPSTTPAPSPTPVPAPSVGTWTVKNATSNVTCIIVKMAIQANITYSKMDNKTGFAVLDIPKNVTVNGTCGNETQYLKLEWLHKQNKSYINVLEMRFHKNITEKKFMLNDITLSLTINPDDFPNASIANITLFHNQTLFPTTLARSYRCMKSQEVNLFSNNSNKTVGTLKVNSVQIEAFHESNSTDFGAIEDCERSTDIVPITVGCALVGLVAVVLIGYLVGRRRSQARGYLSM